MKEAYKYGSLFNAQFRLEDSNKQIEKWRSVHSIDKSIQLKGFLLNVLIANSVCKREADNVDNDNVVELKRCSVIGSTESRILQVVFFAEQIQVTVNAVHSLSVSNPQIELYGVIDLA